MTWIRSRNLVRGLAVLGFVATLGLPASESLRAQPSEQQAGDASARELFAKGQAAYRRGDYDEAIGYWERAYAADPRPLILYNVSQAYERLGKLKKAVETLERYLREAAADDPNQSDARARLSALRERLEKTGVVVEGAPDGAAIYVDDKLWGRAPRPDPIRLEPGSHRVRVELDGYETFRASIVVPPGQQVTVQVEMAERAGGATSPGETDAREASDPLAETGAPRAEAASGGGSLVPVLMMAGGGALAGAGAVVGYLALRKAQGVAADELGEEEESQARSLALVSDLLLWPGLAVAGGGLVWMLLDDGGEAERPEQAGMRLRPVAGAGFVGLRAEGSF